MDATWHKLSAPFRAFSPQLGTEHSRNLGSTVSCLFATISLSGKLGTNKNRAP